MWYNKRLIKFTARVMLCTLTIQLVYPAAASALTSGPSQPEVQSFEPVGTTDMVDLFSGDFVYNIPLLDVEGYPINISYHGGADMEQEASWVGLGWNINPGVINRSVRGLPDDFNGDVITRTLNIKPEKNIRVGIGGGAELAGLGKPKINLSGDIGVAVNVSNYRGVSADITLSAGVNVAGFASAGINLGVGSQSGADVDLNAGLRFNSSMIVGSDVSAGFGVNGSTGYSSRSGLKDLSLRGSVSLASKSGSGASIGTSAVVPIGVKNIVPVVTNKTEMTIYRGQVKLGLEAYSLYPHAYVSGMLSTLKFLPNGDMPGYGYLYAQNASDASIMDFTRDGDGMFNETMSYLPVGNMTYDIYSVSGQGTGGSFRPFRNDFGSVYDPVVSSEAKDKSLEIEAGLGNLFEIGGDFSWSTTDITSGPWQDYQRQFTSRTPGNIYENTYFKQAGEVTETNPGLFAAIQGLNPVDGKSTGNIPLKKPGSDAKRDPRGNLIYYFTTDEAVKTGVATSVDISNYTSNNGFQGGSDGIKTSVSRYANGRSGSKISEIVQVQTDGRRYVYGIAAMNTKQDEITMAVSNQDNNGLVTYTDQENSLSNESGRDYFYSKTSTPPFAHSYLLTSVLSTDYVDIKGDGVTDDDFGSFTKFNYSLKNAAFTWQAPYGNHKAQFNAGYKSDPKDNKANYMEGTREQWLMHSVETKNFVAEFYTSSRLDARGKNKDTDLSYKLDSIKLFNKHDRFINGATAVPVKTVMFQYDYSLCQGVSNNINVINDINYSGADGGKLTLKRIYVRYGNSERSMISPYQFRYGYNPKYSFASRDRWGGYKPNGLSGGMSNSDYPFVEQNSDSLDNYAGAWSLDNITLPSGGNIKLQYEADDYAYVMDKPAMEMFKVAGLGSSSGFSGSNQLYQDKNNPRQYLYFNRRLSSEKSNLSAKQNYLKNTSLLYYNANTRLVNNACEPVKGYAEATEVGYCSDGIHGYIKLKPVNPAGGGASLNPISYTAINFGRYYLPHIMFPGSDPDNNGLENIIQGIAYAFGELVSIAENPVKRMTEEGRAKEIQLNSSYVRLNSPGLKKKGGGQRVKRIEFYDNWNKLAGGNAQNASYGKVYDYTTDDQGSYGRISSGVASYEPMIGGDENPFREPDDYIAQAGGSFPPHEAVGLYQELPVGESLYPGASVGYSKVTVKSIHQQEGRSSQGEDIYDFYTAKDFPVQVATTTLNPLTTEDKYSLTSQSRIFEGSQGYTLIFNDMHGKPKKTEHRIIKPVTGQTELVSYKEYEYFTDGGKLSNDIPVIQYDPVSQKMKKQTKTVGLEADITIDTREKMEETKSKTIYANLNTFLVGIFPLPVPFGYYHWFNFKNEFRSVVATKVVQQYGILKEVRSSQEGAVTTVRNEAFDPVTGQALITSVNNEYNDKEYSVNYPAWWGYKSMGPSYENTGYTEKFNQVEVNNYEGELPTGPTCNNYSVGDELLISYNYNGTRYENNVWVTGFRQDKSDYGFTTQCYVADQATANVNMLDTVYINVAGNFLGFPHPLVKPRYKYQQKWPGQNVNGNGQLTNVSIKVIRSGAKNQLNESIQSYTGMDIPFDGNGLLKNDLTRLINISAKEFSDTLTAILPKYDSLQNPAYFDSLNIYVNGTRQIKRVLKEYAYIKNRNYNGSGARNAGLFSAKGLWNNSTSIGSPYQYIDTFFNCRAWLDTLTGYPMNPQPSGDVTFLYHITGYYPLGNIANTAIYNSFLAPYPQSDPNWVTARTVTKYSPWGFELENKDAIGNYTAAMYGYNQQLPVALAQNAKQPEIFFDGFEDYSLLQVLNNFASFRSSPLQAFFTLTGITGTTTSNPGYNRFDMGINTSLTVTQEAAHTGKYSLKSNGTTIVLDRSGGTIQTGQPGYQDFNMQDNKKYVLSYWIKPVNANGIYSNYPIPAGSGFQIKSRIIEGWQQVEAIIPASPGATGYNLNIPANTYIDDIRIYPFDANMKSFVYDPVNQKLIATLDENNYATFYEYDQEGNLVRTKKETDKGIITVMESRSANVKTTN